MTTYADLDKGDRIELRGNAYEVVKAKRKGKVVKLTVKGDRGTFSSEVKAKGEVALVALEGPAGEQQRWATPEEHAADEPRATALPTGDASVTKRPAKPQGSPWSDKPTDSTEVLLDQVMGAHLVGEATDENVGYYVPPVDVSTVAAHMLIFHGVAGDQYATAADALTLHEQHHDDAKTGAAMHVNHWHTKKRP